jgi:hypothetical protein
MIVKRPSTKNANLETGFRNFLAENLIYLQRAETKVEKVVLNAKRSTWKNFSNKLDIYSPLSNVHSFINRMAGKNTKDGIILTLQHNIILLTSNQHKAEAF